MPSAPRYDVRHATAPTPSGCRWCGTEQRSHGQRWIKSAGMHMWTAPTNEQRLARMKARRASRVGGIS